MQSFDMGVGTVVARTGPQGIDTIDLQIYIDNGTGKEGAALLSGETHTRRDFFLSVLVGET